MTATVHLGYDECLTAATIGARRELRALYVGKNNYAHLSKTDGLRRHIYGAIGEMAVAKYLNRYWNPAVNGNFQSLPGDVGDRAQVRTTVYPHGKLWVFPHDRDNDVFILVAGYPPEYQVLGWLTGTEAKNPEWFGTVKGGGSEPAYWIDQTHLHDTAGLLTELLNA